MTVYYSGTEERIMYLFIYCDQNVLAVAGCALFKTTVFNRISYVTILFYLASTQKSAAFIVKKSTFFKLPFVSRK